MFICAHIWNTTKWEEKEGRKERKERGRKKEGGRRRIDNSGQRQQQIFGGQKADGIVQESWKPSADRGDSHKKQTDSHSRTPERLGNCRFRHCRRQAWTRQDWVKMWGPLDHLPTSSTQKEDFPILMFLESSKGATRFPPNTLTVKSISSQGPAMAGPLSAFNDLFLSIHQTQTKSL